MHHFLTNGSPQLTTCTQLYIDKRLYNILRCKPKFFMCTDFDEVYSLQFSPKKGISGKYYAVINANAISSDLSGDDLIKKFRA